ncbi:3375_t:CDS:2, partial [Funneliformis mosseae]
AKAKNIIIQTYERHISKLNDTYDLLQYSLLFPYSEYEWHDNILRANIIESIPESEFVIEDRIQIEE